LNPIASNDSSPSSLTTHLLPPTKLLVSFPPAPVSFTISSTNDTGRGQFAALPRLTLPPQALLFPLFHLFPVVSCARHKENTYSFPDFMAPSLSPFVSAFPLSSQCREGCGCAPPRHSVRSLLVPEINSSFLPLAYSSHVPQLRSRVTCYALITTHNGGSSFSSLYLPRYL